MLAARYSRCLLIALIITLPLSAQDTATTPSPRPDPKDLQFETVVAELTRDFAVHMPEGSSVSAMMRRQLKLPTHQVIYLNTHCTPSERDAAETWRPSYNYPQRKFTINSQLHGLSRNPYQELSLDEASLLVAVTATGEIRSMQTVKDLCLAGVSPCDARLPRSIAAHRPECKKTFYGGGSIGVFLEDDPSIEKLLITKPYQSAPEGWHLLLLDTILLEPGT